MAKRQTKAGNRALNAAWAAANPGRVSPDGTRVTGGGLASSYSDGTRVEVRDGKMVVVDASGNVIPGATPFVNGNGRGVRNLVDEITDLPAGSFDPSLIYQGQNANLGQLYNAQDFQTAWAGYDPDTQPGDLAGAGRNVQDYWNQRGGLAEALARANQDYGTGTETIGRNYRVQGNNQLQAINQAGALGGGALAQALAKRTEAQGRDQGALDLSWKRYAEDNTRATTDLTTNFRRGFADGNVTLQRGSESNALYQGGLLGAASAQAQQSGMLADNPAYQTHNGVLYQVTADGKRRPVKTKRPKPPRAQPSTTSDYRPDFGPYGSYTPGYTP